MQTMTIIVPCYNEEEALPYFYEEISKIRQQLTEISLKLLFINDGSTDNTLAILKSLLLPIAVYIIFPFPVILEKKRLFMPV